MCRKSTLESTMYGYVFFVWSCRLALSNSKRGGAVISKEVKKRIKREGR